MTQKSVPEEVVEDQIAEDLMSHRSNNVSKLKQDSFLQLPVETQTADS